MKCGEVSRAAFVGFSLGEVEGTLLYYYTQLLVRITCILLVTLRHPRYIYHIDMSLAQGDGSAKVIDKTCSYWCPSLYIERLHPLEATVLAILLELHVFTHLLLYYEDLW